MEGIFHRKTPWLAYLLTLMGLFSLLMSTVIPGILCCFVGLIFFFFNHGACLRVEENGVRAKYHWFGRLRCSFDEIDFVYPQLNTLTILLKNGKQHVIGGIMNSWEISDHLRRCIYAPEAESADALRRELDQVQEARKKLLEQTIIGCILLFANIFLGVVLTGGRETEQFIPRDWVFISIAAVAEVMTVIWTFVMAARCGKTMLPIAHLQFRLRKVVIAAAPRDHVLRVYADPDFRWRLTVRGFPQDSGVYCGEEQVGMNYRLECFHNTGIYPTIDDIPEEFFEGMIDIT